MEVCDGVLEGEDGKGAAGVCSGVVADETNVRSAAPGVASPTDVPPELGGDGVAWDAVETRWLEVASSYRSSSPAVVPGSVESPSP